MSEEVQVPGSLLPQSTTSLYSVPHYIFFLFSNALHSKCAGDAESLLGGTSFLSPLYAVVVVLGMYIVWLPFGAFFSFLASFLSVPGVAVLSFLACLKCGKFVARMMVFPGSLPYFSLSMEREYASRLRGGLLLSLKGIESALLQTAKCSRGSGATTERRDLLAALSTLQFPSKISLPEDVDLLASSISRPFPKITLPGVSSASPTPSPMAEFFSFYTALLAHRRAALVGGAVRAQIHPGVPWGPAVIGEGWSQHSAVTLHYTEISLKLIGAVCGALSLDTVSRVPHNIDLLGDPMPIEGGPAIQSRSLSLKERVALGSLDSLDLLLSPAPLYDQGCSYREETGATTSSKNGEVVDSMSLALTLAAALASIKRLSVILPWLEVVPHYGFGSGLAAQDVAEAFLKDSSVSGKKNEAAEEDEVSNDGVPHSLPPDLLNALKRSSQQAQKVGLSRLKGLRYALFHIWLWLIGLTQVLHSRLTAALGFSGPHLAFQEGNNLNLSESLPSVSLAASHLAPVAHSLGLSPTDLQSALALVNSRDVLNKKGGGASPFTVDPSTQGEALHQGPGLARGAAFLPSFLSSTPLIASVWRAVIRCRSALIKALAAPFTPSPVAGFPFLRAEASSRGGSIPVKIPMGLKAFIDGGFFSSQVSWKGRFVDALLIPAGSEGSAWTGGATCFAPSRDVTIEDLSTESDSNLIAREIELHSFLLGERSESVIPTVQASVSTTLPQSQATTSAFCRRRGPNGLPQEYTGEKVGSWSPYGPSFGASQRNGLWGSQQGKENESENTGSFFTRLRRWIPCFLPSAHSSALFPDWNPPSPQRLDAFRSAYLKSPSRTLVIMCPPNAGLWETSLRHHEAARFYTQVIGADVLLWNYVGYGRPVGGGSSQYTEGYEFPGTSEGLHISPPSPSFLGSGPSPLSIREDALSLIAWARSTLAPNSIIVHGESLGGCAAAAIAREGSAEVVIVDRSFDDLGRTASYVVGQWARPALELCTGWSRGITSSGEDIAAALSLNSPYSTLASSRLKLVVVANDAHDTVISSPSSLMSTLANAVALCQTVEGCPLPISWGEATQVSSLAFFPTFCRLPLTAMKRIAAEVKVCWLRLRENGDNIEESPTSLPYFLPAPRALAALHPLEPSVATALQRLSVRLHAFLLYLTHETTWAPQLPGNKPSMQQGGLNSSTPGPKSTLTFEENTDSIPPLALSHVSPWEEKALRNRLASLSFSGTPPQSCARAAAVAWVLGKVSSASPASLFTQPPVDVHPVIVSPSAHVETLRPPLLPKEVAIDIIGASSSLAFRFERDMEGKALELAARQVPSQLTLPIRSLLVSSSSAGGLSPRDVALSSLGTVDSCVTASEISAALNDASAFSSWLASSYSPYQGGDREGVDKGGASSFTKKDKMQSWATPILVALAGLNNGLGQRCGEAVTLGGVHAVKTWLAGGLLWGWQEHPQNGALAPSIPVLNYTHLKIKAKDASRTALLARASSSSHPSGTLSIVLSSALTNRSVFTSLARESSYLTFQPPASLTLQASNECAWTETVAAGLPWSAVEVALQRVREANPLLGFQKQGGNAFTLLHSHKSRVWGEAQGILEEVQMLRARVAESSKVPWVKLDVGLGGGSPPISTSPSQSPPQLVVLPLSCGHNLPWMPAESAILACALREVLKL